VLLFWLRELIELCLLRKLTWCDTRDLSCDGNTKGSIPRDALLALMQEGRHIFNHAFETYKNRRVTDLVPKQSFSSQSKAQGTETYLDYLNDWSKWTTVSQQKQNTPKSVISWSWFLSFSCFSHFLNCQPAVSVSRFCTASTRLQGTMALVDGGNPFLYHGPGTLVGTGPLEVYQIRLSASI